MKKAKIKIVGATCVLEDSDNNSFRKTFKDIGEMVIYARDRKIEIENKGVLSGNHLKMLNGQTE
jgi:hypothetical protein